jgi:hypothetical protein
MFSCCVVRWIEDGDSMKFTELLFDIDAYNDKILSMIDGEGTILFLDTNILSFLFKLNKESREEFYAWVDKTKNRIKVPEYVVHEYNKRCISNTLNEFNDLSKNAKKISDAIKQQYEYVRLRVDEVAVKRVSGYESASQFIELYNKSNKIFSDLSTMADATGESLFSVASEIKKYFEDKVIDSKFSNLLSECHTEFISRSHCAVPPGFKDKDSKKDNTYGDYIVWKEILNYCKNDEIKSAILVTRDKKKDFVYAPLKIISNNKIKWNTNSEYVVAHPFLVSEFKNQTNDGIFEIIDFYQLIELLSKSSPQEYVNIARAVQVEIPEQDNSKDDVLNSGIVEEARIEVGVSSIKLDDSCSVEVCGKILISESSYADDKYVCEPGNAIDEIIEAFKTYTWNKQNSAILSLVNLYGKNFNDYSADKWFVLGRNIYQSACGNSFKSMNFMDTLQYKLSAFCDDAANCILYGMAYEIYFDSKAQVRGIGKFKSNYLDEVYRNCCEGRFNIAKELINKDFDAVKSKLLFDKWPCGNILFKLDESLNPSGGIVVHNILLNKKSILLDVSLLEDSYFTVQIEYTKEKIRELLCSFCGLPTSVVSFENVGEGFVYTFARNMVINLE